MAASKSRKNPASKKPPPARKPPARPRPGAKPDGAYAFDELLFPAKARFAMRLIVRLPKGARRVPCEVYARQLYAREEVGRVTWRLVPPAKR